jgi:hypothetical protein
MAITEGTKLEISVEAALYSQQVMNVWTYEVGGTFSGISAGSVAHAYWNHVKTTYRALVSTEFGPTFTRVLVKDLSDPTGDYGEYGVPVNERAGTRSATGVQGMPGFAAAGVRLTVATRVTRPGQKRFPFLLEDDSAGYGLTSGFTTLVNALMTAATVSVTLGAPALGMDLNPIVVRRDPTTGAVTAFQQVTGFAINPNTTSQVSRKIGRGS